MKRPLAWTGLCVPCAMAVAFSFQERALWLGWAILIVGLGLFAGCRQRENAKLIPLLAMAAALGCFWMWYYQIQSLESLKSANHASVTVEGVVQERIESDGDTVLLVRGHAEKIVQGRTLLWRIWVIGDSAPGAGERIRCPVLASTVPTDTPWERTLLADGVRMEGRTYETPNSLGRKSGPMATLNRWRERLNGRLHQLYSPKQAALLSAMLFGHREGIGSELTRSLSYSGVYHLIAISGMHLMVIVGLATWWFKKKQLTGPLSYMLSILVAWLVAILGGLGPPVVRAACLVTIMAVGRCLGRQEDPLTSLGVAALVLVMQNPLVVLGLSFQSTFLSCLGLFILSPRLFAWSRKQFDGKVGLAAKVQHWLVNLACTSFAAQVFLFPLLYFHFGFLSFGILLSETAIFPILTPLLELGYLSVLLPAGWLLRLIVAIERVLADWFLWVVNQVAGLRLVFFGNHWFSFVWILFAGIILICIFWRRPAPIIKQLAACLLLLPFLVGTLLTSYIECHLLRVVWMPSGSAVVLVRQGRAAVLALEGDSEQVRDWLDRYHVRQVDYLHIEGDDFVKSEETLPFLYAFPPVVSSVPDSILASSYLERVPIGESIPLSYTEVKLLGGVTLYHQPEQTFTIQAGEITLVKCLTSWEMCDIIEESSEESLLMLSCWNCMSGTYLPADVRLEPVQGGGWQLLLWMP